MNDYLERNSARLTLLILVLSTLILLAPALRPGYTLLAADLPYLLDPLWQPLAPAGAVAGANPILGDQFYQFHPWQVAAWEMVARGELPTWNPAINGGQPLFGNGLAGILSPFNLASRFFPFTASYAVGALLRLWVAGGFTYLYARAIGLSLPASWLAMISFTLSGPLISWLWATPSHVLVWFPALLWTGEKLLTMRHLRWALAAAGALALLILSSQPEIAFQIGVVWAIYLLCRAWWLEGSLGQALRRHAAGWALVAALGVGLGAVELLGFVDALRDSFILHHRQLAESATEPANLATWLRRLFLSWQEWPTLITTFMPRFLGREADESYWYPFGNSIENNSYAGVLPLLLAIFALWAAWRDRTNPARRWIWLWGGIALGTIGVATSLPLLAAVRDLPFLSLTLPTRLRGPYVFAVAILAGFGLDLLLNTKRRRPFWILLASAAAINIVLVATAYIGFTHFASQLIASGRAYMEANAGSPALDRPLAELYVLVATRQEAKLAMLRPSNPIMVLPLLVAGAVALLFWLRRKGNISTTGLACALIVITWLDLLWIGAGFNSAVPAAWLEPTPPAITYLQNQPGIFRVVGTNLILNPNMSMLTHLEDVRGYDALAINRYQELLAGLDGYAPSGYHNYFRHLNDPRLDLFNATYGLSRTPPSDPRWQPVLSDPSGVTLYRSQSALPRAYGVYAAEVVANAEQSLARTLDTNFDPRHSVVLEETPAGWSPPAIPPSEAPQITFNKRRATTVQMEVNTPMPALLVLLDTYAPGWHATVDQQPTPIYPANHAFRAVVVPAGHHTVTFTYAPPLLAIGAMISGGSLLVLLGLLVWLCARRRTVRLP
jgi:hypothetical protein